MLNGKLQAGWKSKRHFQNMYTVWNSYLNGMW